MYQHHYGLNAAPFSIAPDPQFLFMSDRHREALAHLLHGVSGAGGFILLTGEVGTGKTTLCRSLLEQLPDNVRLAYVLNPRVSPIELLQTLCDELRIAPPDAKNSIKALTDVITERLIENHRRGLNTVLMIDEAQQLATECLEQVRLLTNLETTEKKLLQIILIGQPELQERLASPELRQLAQRITARYHLLPLNLNETASYVWHRLQHAGAKQLLFSHNGLRALHRYSGGIPRLINTIAERALLGAYARQQTLVNDKHVQQAAREILGDAQFLHMQGRSFSQWLLAKPAHIALMLFLLMITGFSTYFVWRSANAVNSDDAASIRSPATKPLQDNTTSNMNATPVATQDGRVTDEREALVDLLLGRQVPDRRGDEAAHVLWQLRGLDFLATRDGHWCDMAQKKLLRCDSGFADLAQLRAMNTVAMLKFFAPVRGVFYGTLTALNKQTAEIQFGTRIARLPLVDLQTIWSGEYTVIWQPIVHTEKPLAEGSSGPDVIALASALAQAQGETTGAISARFDKVFAEHIKRFQQQHALVADGVVGTQTLLAISSRQPGALARLDHKKLETP